VLSSRIRVLPPVATHAEAYYYQKQIDAETMMVAALVGGGEVRGRLVWYDRDGLGFELDDGRQVAVPKREVKYLHKQAVAPSVPARRDPYRLGGRR